MLKLKLFISFALTSLFLITGCSENSTGNDSSDLDKALIGEWKIEQIEAGGIKGPATGITFIFNSDGTFERNTTGITAQSGTWKAKDGTLYLNDKNTPEYTIDYTFKESQLVTTEGTTKSFYSKTGGTGESETNPLIGEWELYKIEDGDFTSTKGNPDWEEQTMIITSNRITILMDDSEEHFDYTYKNGEIVPEDGTEIPPIHIENSQLVITDGETKGYYSKIDETGNDETNPLIGEWELYKIEDGDFTSTKGDPGWQEQTIIITSNRITILMDDSEEHFDYTYKNGEIVPEDGIEAPPIHIENSQLVITDGETKGYYSKIDETGDDETTLIGEWELFKIDLMGEIIEEDDPDWENTIMTITSNKIIYTYESGKDSSNYTCVDSQLLIKDGYGEEIILSITYSFESENVLIMDSGFDDFPVEKYYRKL